MATVCPECAQGKHSNCTGWAFDEHDNEVPCECEQIIRAIARRLKKERLEKEG